MRNKRQITRKQLDAREASCRASTLALLQTCTPPALPTAEQLLACLKHCIAEKPCSSPALLSGQDTLNTYRSVLRPPAEPSRLHLVPSLAAHTSLPSAVCLYLAAVCIILHPTSLGLPLYVFASRSTTSWPALQPTLQSHRQDTSPPAVYCIPIHPAGLGKKSQKLEP